MADQPHTVLTPERRKALAAAQLRAVVSDSFGVSGPAAGFEGGATLTADDSRGWLLVLDDAVRGLGRALAWSQRQRLTELHVVVGADDPADAAAILARRARLFTNAPHIWQLDGRDVRPAIAAPSPESVAPPPEAELLRLLLLDAGLDVVVEHGVMRGEVLGLEVAHVEPASVRDSADVTTTTDSGDTQNAPRLRVGVGRYDQEAADALWPDEPDRDALARVVARVREHRRVGAAPHPLNRLQPERWLRARLLDDPMLVGATALEAVAPAVPRRNLKEPAPAPALGRDLEGAPLMVVCSSGIDLDAVPAAADDRLMHAPDARLIVAVRERDVHPVQAALAAALIHPAELVGIPDATANNEARSS